MDNREIIMRQKQTEDLFHSIVYKNRLDTSVIAEGAVWYAGSVLLHIDKKEAEYHLKHTLVDAVADEMKIIFADSSYIGAECISVIGELEYHTRSESETLIRISFHINWVLEQEEWKLKQLITSKSREAGSEEKAEQRRAEGMNDARLLQEFPTGLICRTVEEHLPIRRMNDKMLSMLDYAAVTDYMHYTGNLLMTAIHPEDIGKFREYVEALLHGEEVEYVCVRLRKKDYSYMMIQVFGKCVEHSWLIFVCMDYSEQQDRLDNLQEKSQKLAKLRDDYRILVDNLPSGFHRCALFAPVHVEYVSDSLCDMTGYTRHDIHDEMKSVFIEMVVPEDRQIFIDAVASLMQYPHTEQMIYRIKKKDGSIIRVLDRMRSVRHADGKMWGYSVVVDLDEHPIAHPAVEAAAGVQAAETPKTAHSHTVEIHTFGYFEVLVDRRPIAFRSAKARELLAVLVDRRGNFTSRESIISMLWENETVNTTTLTRCRKAFMNLVTELKSYGIEDIVETENGQRRIIPEKVSCDLFDYLNGVPSAVQLFRGEYLSEYSWSEITLATLMPEED